MAHSHITTVIDVEARSHINIKKAGMYRYSEHHSTELLCVGYAFVDRQKQSVSEPFMIVSEPGPAGAVALWKHENMQEVRQGNWRHLQQCIEASETVVAHNVEMEIEMLRHKASGLKVREDQWRCTAARARAMGLPGALANLALAMGSPHPKDMDGHAVMLKCCKPRPQWIKDRIGREYFDDADRLSRNYLYCARDVLSEAWLDLKLPQLSDREYQIWWRYIKAARRGIAVDDELMTAAQEMADVNTIALNTSIADATMGELLNANSPMQVIAFCRSRGIMLPNLQRDTVETALKELTHMPKDVKTVLKVRLETSKSSLSKIGALRAYRCKDGRVHGLNIYHGAHTGRTTGSGPQPLNLPRPANDHNGKPLDPTKAVQYVMSRNSVAAKTLGPLANVVSTSIRGILRAGPGKIFRVADFSAIEACGVMWLAECHQALEIMQTSPSALYIHFGSMIAGRQIDKKNDPHERQLGKQGILGLGYSMNWQTFIATCDGYGITISETEAKRIVYLYRDTYPEVPAMWKAVNNATIMALRNPGVAYEVHRCQFLHRDGWFIITLPSGRNLYYPGAQMAEGKYGPVMEYQTMKMGQWSVTYTYGAKTVENIVQGFCRDLLEDKNELLENNGFQVNLTIYDEALAEVYDFQANKTQELFEQTMSGASPWCHGMPVHVEGYEDVRFRKG